MRKGMLACLIQRVTVGQLGVPQLTKLLRRGHEFEFGRDSGLHTQQFFLSSREPERSAAFPPTSEESGYPRRKIHEGGGNLAAL